MTAPNGVTAAGALARRIACARQLLDPADRTEPTDEAALFDSLLALVRLVGHDTSRAWLLTVAMTAAMPEQSLVRTVVRGLALREPEEAVPWLLSVTMPLAVGRGNAGADLRVVSDRPVVGVALAARSDFVTGIQRVARGVAAQWAVEHDIELVTWTTHYGAFRPVDPSERSRLTEGAGVEAFKDMAATDARLQEHPEVLAPWGVPVVVIELPTQPASERLAALAEFTACSVRLVGYDCIPVASAELVNPAEPEKFGH